MITPNDKMTELLRIKENEKRVIIPIFTVSFEAISKFFRRFEHVKTKDTDDPTDSDITANHR